MMKQMTWRSLRGTLTMTALATLLVPAALVAGQAISTDRLTFSFSGPVAIPGVTLAPGTYKFEAMDSGGAQHIVKITNEDGTKLFATTFTVPVRRLDPKEDVIVKFAETKTGVAPALRAWFAPGSLTGHQFVYPEDQAKAIADATQTLVLSADRDDLSADMLHVASIYVINARGEREAYRSSDWDELPRVASADPPDTSGSR